MPSGDHGMSDEDRPRHAAGSTVPGYTVGEKVDDLSVRDFDDRIALLRAEIERLEAAKRAKQVARDEAGSIFKTIGSKTAQM